MHVTAACHLGRLLHNNDNNKATHTHLSLKADSPFRYIDLEPFTNLLNDDLHQPNWIERPLLSVLMDDWTKGLIECKVERASEKCEVVNRLGPKFTHSSVVIAGMR